MDLVRAGELAIDLMEEHGLFTRGWRFEWDHARRIFGRCWTTRKIISLSKPLTRVNTEEEIRDTILHEIAHALTPDDRGHGYSWQVMAVKVGARPETCASASRAVGIKGRYRAVCPDCGVEVTRFRRPSRKMLESGYHTSCRRKPGKGKLAWYDGVMKIGVVKSYVPAPPVSAKPTQAQVSELWERLNRLEGK